MSGSNRAWAGGLLLTAGVLAYFFYPPFRYAAWVAAGRGSVCPMSRAVQVDSDVRNLTKVKDRILKASRLVRADGPLELWETPKGQYWIPAGNRFVLPFNLAEMEEHIYGSGAGFVHPGDIVLDCGASDGDFTKEALRAGAKLVVSVEISPNSAECIRRNLSREIEEHRVIRLSQRRLGQGRRVAASSERLELRIQQRGAASGRLSFRRAGPADHHRSLSGRTESAKGGLHQDGHRRGRSKSFGRCPEYHRQVWPQALHRF